MLNRNTVFAELAEVLSTIYRSQANAERIAFDAGLNLSRVAVYPTPIDYWREIISKAYFQSCLDQLVDLACKEYSLSIPLLEARQRYVDWAESHRPVERSASHLGSGQLPMDWHQVGYQGSTRIDESSPLLIGVLVDVSQSMMNALEKSPKRSGFSRKRLFQSINTIMEKAIFYCRTPESKEVLPKIKLFVYGYGFGTFRYHINDIFARIGIMRQETEAITIPTNSIRDMFAEAAENEGLSTTPSARDLYEHLDSYKKSIEAQLVDAGLGRSSLNEGLQLVYDRFREELAIPHYPHPILIIISDGRLAAATDEEGIRQIATNLSEIGIETVSCYVGEKNITRVKSFYEIPGNEWPNEAALLFDCASATSGSSKITNAVIGMAKENGWTVPDGAKLFVQVNQTRTLEEVVEFILSALED